MSTLFTFGCSYTQSYGDNKSNSVHFIYISQKFSYNYSMREFKFFRGYVDEPFLINWDDINRISDINRIPIWGGVNYTSNYNTITNPNYIITTTPGTGTYTIPYNGTINTTTGFSSLTTSNPNGTTTYTTGGFGGTLTTNTATYLSNSFKN